MSLIFSESSAVKRNFFHHTQLRGAIANEKLSDLTVYTICMWHVFTAHVVDSNFVWCEQCTKSV